VFSKTARGRTARMAFVLSELLDYNVRRIERARGTAR
jgi:hypothetical protein